MRALRHEDVQELLGAYALDALEEDEAELVEDHLRDCPRCRAEVRDHRETAAMLAFGGGEAPPGLWERIAANLEEAPPRLQLGRVIPIAESRWRRIGVRMLTAAAVVLSLVALSVSLLVRDDEGGVDEIARMRDDPGTVVIRLAGVGTRESAEIWLSDQRGYLADHNLARLSEGETYQLWGQKGDTMISLGVLGRAPGHSQFAAVGDYVNLAISVEPAGGVAQPTGRVVAAGAVPTS